MNGARRSVQSATFEVHPEIIAGYTNLRAARASRQRATTRPASCSATSADSFAVRWLIDT